MRGGEARSAGSGAPPRPRSDLGEHERLRLALESCPVGIVMVDERGTILLANGETLRMFGYRHDELLGRPIEVLVPAASRAAHPALRERFCADPETRAMGAGRDLFGERRDGSSFPVEVGLRPERTADGLLVSCSIVDITARKEIEARVQTTLEALRRSNESLEQLTRVLAHDVRAPLRGIVSIAEMMAEDLAAVAPAESLENLALLRQRCLDLAELVQGILRYSRAGLAAVREPVDAGAVARRALESLEVQAGVRVAIDDLPVVHGDPTQLAQVFQNLIANALAHLGKPTGSVRVSAEAEGAAWRFRVEDSGVGIPEKDLERVFGLFEQVAAAGREPRGSGLGLAIVKRIVEGHGGSVRARSRPGEWTEMSFTLPRAPAPAESRSTGAEEDA